MYSFLHLSGLFISATERLVTAGHDISDGGLITCLLEMAFAGNCGIEVDLKKPSHGS